MPRPPNKIRHHVIRPVEAVILVGSAALFALCFDQANMFERLVAFMEAHEAWQLDEYFTTLALSGIGFVLLAVRRAADLAREIDQREAAEERANQLARHDPLTGLANRRVLQDELPALIARAATAGEQCSLFCIDLDHFKPVNDVHGHETGDAVLVEVSDRLTRIARDGLLARVGGDEFVLVVVHGEGSDADKRLATRIIRGLSASYRVGDRKIEIGATIGIARSPVDAHQPEELLRAADVAMYEAKRGGRGTCRFFQTEMDDRLRARATLEADLRQAIESGQILPYYQPVMALADGKIIGYEALARWHHPERGTIAPDEFIPIAEDLGLIDMLSVRILHQGCIAARDWAPDVTLSINISPIQLKDPWLSARLLAVLSETGFAPGRLIVEVTENAIIEDIDAVAEVFQSLQRTGIRIALDDFGKGYSSLSHLRQLRFNHLKIDSSFVRTMEAAESRKIVRAVAGLGRALGMPVTAEGVETEEAAEILRSIGCEQAQGFFYGRPLPAGELGVSGAVNLPPLAGSV
ncbi:putative bifunctional diguanylate cyclase/phosphodiesterase [Sphingomonas sp. TDK1]|uniref:putative bifunctional diguanylate cyclase/phosphodiesterase n=1 Tax=Sphingomonas sp. TDK1 TaxID=453247 RepID=UPI000AAE9FEC|nr:EAL domain-containing protein [Sphingomonas sp. TDK1]